MTIGSGSNLVTSVIGGSNVVSNITSEVVKRGWLYTIQTVIPALPVGGTFNLLLDPKAFTGKYFVIYDLSYAVTQGKSIATFYTGGNYSHGTNLAIYNRNENSLNIPQGRVSRDPIITTLGNNSGVSFLAGVNAQGANTGGGGNKGDINLPLEINRNVDRILQFVQSGGTGTYDMEFKLVFGEIPGY